MSEHAPKHLAEEDQDPIIGDPPPKANTLLSNGVYDKIKFLALVLLPALGTLYFALAGVWHLPKAEEVVNTIIAVDAFLGVLLKYLSTKYDNSDAKYDGVIDVSEIEHEDGIKTKVASLNLKHYENPADVVAQKEVLFKVNQS